MEKRYVSVKNDWGATSGGQIQFANLIKQGALTPNSRGGFEGAGGFWRNWDGCSSTVSETSNDRGTFSADKTIVQPWLKSDASGQIITYDDTDSISLKAQFAAQAGLRGCNIFSVDGDYVNGGFPLTDAARSGLGL
jgi:chitinase